MSSQHIIIMGVSGCGKSTTGSLLAERLGWTFFDGDDFHSSANISKMQRGISLNDEDRQDWLETQRAHLINLCQRNVSSVLACSALKAKYRTLLAEPFYNGEIANSSVMFLWLEISIIEVRKRLKTRNAHFMNPKLIQSQFDTLEEPNAEQEELSMYKVNAFQAIEKVVDSCVHTLCN